LYFLHINIVCLKHVSFTTYVCKITWKYFIFFICAFYIHVLDTRYLDAKNTNSSNYYFSSFSLQNCEIKSLWCIRSLQNIFCLVFYICLILKQEYLYVNYEYPTLKPLLITSHSLNNWPTLVYTHKIKMSLSWSFWELVKSQRYQQFGTPATSLSFLGNKERQSMPQLWASQSQGTSRVAIVKNKHISSKHHPILFSTRDQKPNNAHDS
jgi:hypothetical protein